MTTKVCTFYTFDERGNVAQRTSSSAADVANGSFETPSAGPAGQYGSFLYSPTGATWTFTGGSGLAANGSGFTSGNPNAPDGTQVAFLQDDGSFSQSLTLAAGTYALSFAAAQRGSNYNGGQDFQVLVDSAVVGTFRPSGLPYGSYTSSAFTVTAGSHTLEFQGLDTVGGDNTALLDTVQVLASPSQSGPTSTDTYDAYGTRTSTVSTQPDPWGYEAQAGYYTDTETGLILCTHRFYDPSTGRWLTRDPMGYGGGMNLYEYTGNNAINRIDPSGYFITILIGAGIGLLVGGAIDFGYQMWQNGGNIHCVDWTKVGVSALTGAATGAFGVPIAGISSTILAAGASAFVGGAANGLGQGGLNLLEGNPVGDGVVTAAGWGAIGGAAGSGISSIATNGGSSLAGTLEQNQILDDGLENYMYRNMTTPPLPGSYSWIPPASSSAGNGLGTGVGDLLGEGPPSTSGCGCN